MLTELLPSLWLHPPVPTHTCSFSLTHSSNTLGDSAMGQVLLENASDYEPSFQTARLILISIHMCSCLYAYMYTHTHTSPYTHTCEHLFLAGQLLRAEVSHQWLTRALQ